MKNTMACILALFFLANAAGFAHASEIRTSICQLALDGAQMQGRRVRLTATYSTDLLEHSSLNDRRCPRVYLVPNWDGSHDTSIGIFDTELYAHPNESALTQYRIDVSGKFSWHADAKPHGELVFEKVWTFKRLGNVRKFSK